ncbi:photosystem II stability/assembly factor-like uncharacterized protein [Paenibacillus shirakamiensis]|uniref:Photosystem II stability/assembly factor-like uncharacterized protein n=1 Tax=Paenibacillus shirakamiensis TaxID=1265935 RepID=A0ABS4JQ52_9BACL|nr:YCF48-related protein [Paenibacillus shirakamiensis]MBP2002754.1 photosystem II stability/assembly factor-like uncharacterized protein [Paenibacillus shirakamiensis]
MNPKRSRWTKSAFVFVVLMMVFSGFSALQNSTVTAAPTCGTGDHGLLKKMNNTKSPLHITDISFLNENTGRAAGNGFLIGTSNAGCTWQEIYTGQWQFDQILFPNNVHGYALAQSAEGKAEQLIATKDGGSHWNPVYSAGKTFTNISVLDEKTLVGYTSNGVFKTRDGGNTWAKIPTPANTRASLFTDKALQKGWALTVLPNTGYKIYKTMDGGHSWSTALSILSKVAYGGQLYSSGSQVWALTYGDAGMSQVSYSLYASQDLGKRWNRVIAQSTAGGGPAPGVGSALVNKGPASPGGHPGNMQLIGNQTAYLAGGSPAAGKAGVGRSYDGGRTWSNVPAVLNGFDASISFPSSKTGWLAVTSASDSAVYITHDGGVSWNKKFALPQL